MNGLLQGEHLRAYQDQVLNLNSKVLDDLIDLIPT